MRHWPVALGEVQLRIGGDEEDSRGLGCGFRGRAANDGYGVYGFDDRDRYGYGYVYELDDGYVYVRELDVR